MGDRDLAKVIIIGFLGDIPKQMAMLKGFLDGGDIKAAGVQAHTIKGAAAVMCGEALRNVAFAMEKAAMSSDLDSARSMLGELQTQFERLKRIPEASALLVDTRRV
jgi:HPt (histidine-containing phosphotransfer) domain-containing protein